MIEAEIFAAVVMPNHIHLVLRPLRDKAGELFSLPEILHATKGRSAHAVNKLLNRRGPVWQDECFDHLPRKCEKLREKIYYVLNNPVRKGLVKRWEDYRWIWKSPKVE